MASGLKGKTVSAMGSQRLSEEPGRCCPCELFICCTSLVLTIPVTSLTETKMRERKKNGIVELRNTIWEERGEEAADTKCEEGKALGS